ncbi:MAG: DUF2795 domain-containing protein [Alphaproteobacteria bacterium]
MAINYLELIDGMDFPATRAEIVEYAIENDASEEALGAFRAMPHSSISPPSRMSVAPSASSTASPAMPMCKVSRRIN